MTQSQTPTPSKNDDSSFQYFRIFAHVIAGYSRIFQRIREMVGLPRCLAQFGRFSYKPHRLIFSQLGSFLHRTTYSLHFQLSHGMLGKKKVSADDIFQHFSCFLPKIGFGISCKRQFARNVKVYCLPKRRKS